ncbi:MAG TPA: Yip1 family protein [Ktedonobacteraceae bacterium]
MRDQDEEYPKHQPTRGEQSHHDPFEIQDEGELEDRPRRGPAHQREAATIPQLPRGHARKALIIGVILGVLVSLQGLILTLANADLYRKAAGYVLGNMPVNLAGALVGILFLGLGISLLIYLFGGMLIGRVSVHRRWAFIGGFVGAVISSIIGALLKQIPSYPNAGNTGFSGGALGLGGGLVALLSSTILLGVLAGLVCLFGAWLVTRRHPYYVGYSG